MERQRQALGRRIQTLQRRNLRSLCDQMGFENVDQLIFALAEFATPALRLHLNPNSLPTLARPEGRPATSRARFPHEIMEIIRKELEAGKKSVVELSREYGPSQPTIMRWKRKWGLIGRKSRNPACSMP